MSKKELIKELLKHRYAHRGLHNKPTIPENSMVAFKRAVEQGFGIELDVHLTKDGQLAVIHDSSLKRTCGVDIIIEEITLEEAQAHFLEESEEIIPSFEEVLRLVSGSSPLIIELKPWERNEEALTDKVMEALKGYEGAYCIESFSPAAVSYLKKKYPEVVRGQLAGLLNKETKTVTDFQNFLMKTLLLNIFGRPDFVAYQFEDRETPALKRFKGAKFFWTIRKYEDMKKAEAIGAAAIFEKFNPHDYE